MKRYAYVLSYATADHSPRLFFTGAAWTPGLIDAWRYRSKKKAEADVRYAMRFLENADGFGLTIICIG